MNKKYTCYYCLSTECNFIVRHIDFGRDVFHCSNCELLQTEFVNDDFLSYYYDQIYRKNIANKLSPEYFSFMEARGKSQYRFIAQFSPRSKPKRILDYGAGAGETIKQFSDYGEQIFACEYDTGMNEHLEKIPGIQIVDPKKIFYKKYHKFFDTIILSHVLEHMSNPHAFLNKAWSVLDDEGLLFIEVPNQPREMIEFAQGRLSPGESHLFYFTPETLVKMVEKTGGYEVLALRLDGRSIDEYIHPALESPKFSEKSENTPNGAWIRLLLKRKSDGVVNRSAPALKNIRLSPKTLEHHAYNANRDAVLMEASIRRGFRSIYDSIQKIDRSTDSPVLPVSKYIYLPDAVRSSNYLGTMLSKLKVAIERQRSIVDEKTEETKVTIQKFDAELKLKIIQTKNKDDQIKAKDSEIKEAIQKFDAELKLKILQIKNRDDQIKAKDSEIKEAIQKFDAELKLKILQIKNRDDKINLLSLKISNLESEADNRDIEIQRLEYELENAMERLMRVKYYEAIKNFFKLKTNK
jgi:2-polyprenyl-3-methyl-5-hydroxy-6-metoxy-1,4-benzoquinol methylase